VTKADCLIIIPAYNEAKNIEEILRGIRNLNINIDIAVINDGSKDQTATVVKEAGEQVITLPYNLGYGGALQTGFKYAVTKGYQYIVQFDADGQHDPGDIPIILKMLQTNSADIVIGSRFLGRGTFHPGVWKKIAVTVFRLIIKLATGTQITDPTSGLQGLTKPVFSYYAVMSNYPEDYPDADTLINMILSNYRVKEFPANIKERNFGKGMHTGIKTIFYFVKMLVSISVVLIRKKMERT
jgi:glycosyltransferase involved in cell wall biosynthesis